MDTLWGCLKAAILVVKATTNTSWSTKSTKPNENLQLEKPTISFISIKLRAWSCFSYIQHWWWSASEESRLESVCPCHGSWFPKTWRWSTTAREGFFSTVWSDPWPCSRGPQFESFDRNRSWQRTSEGLSWPGTGTDQRQQFLTQNFTRYSIKLTVACFYTSEHESTQLELDSRSCWSP